MKIVFLLFVLGTVLNVSELKVLTKRSFMDQINELANLDSQISSFLNQNSLDISGLSNQIQNLFNQNLDPNAISNLNTQLLNALNQTQNLDAINKINSQIASLLGPSITSLGELLNSINSVDTTQLNNFNLDFLLSQIPEKLTFQNLLPALETPDLNLLGLSNFIDDLFTNKLTDCLYNQIQDTSKLNPCVSSNSLLMSYLSQLGDIDQALKKIDSFLNLNITTGLAELSQSNLLGSILEIPQVKNLTGCLIELDETSSKYSTCLQIFPDLMNAINSNNTNYNNESFLDQDLRHILLKVVKMADFSKLVQSYLIKDLVNCVNEQFKNPTVLNSCVSTNVLITSVLDKNMIDWLSNTLKVLNDFKKIEIKGLIELLLKTSGLDVQINSVLDQTKNSILIVKDAIAKYNLNNLISNETLLQEATQCLINQFDDLSKLNDCILNSSELKALMNPQVLRNLSAAIQSFTSTLEQTNIPGISLLLSNSGIRNLANNLENLARSIELSIQITTTTKSSKSISLAPSSILISSFIFVYFLF
ncbi:unnamed protein product [Brachionus calyciflorus]|uniref:Uncharacterized protein n=1 Tax=Brachionus calyciflorus TaxID=104777 RepID=A0A813M525_9BILA|nr:unnamed protein product [Brachionus calyciflorus]